MYNRYIPQPDGSFKRSLVPDISNIPRNPAPGPEPEARPPEHKPTESFSPPEPVQRTEDSQQKQEPCIREQPQRRSPHRHTNPRPQHPMPYAASRQNRQPPKQEPQNAHKETSVSSFLQQLLPKDFDTGDLLIVVLLLLMAGDCSEDQNSALLTLALYLFL